jgi:hypothetical protein
MSKQPAPVGDTKESGVGGKDGELSITDAWADPISAPATTAETARKDEHPCFDTANAMIFLLRTAAKNPSAARAMFGSSGNARNSLGNLTHNPPNTRVTSKGAGVLKITRFPRKKFL